MSNDGKKYGEPLSLHPLSLEQAISAALRFNPNKKKEEKNPIKKN